MKFLIVGLGSMGKRRIRNLNALGERNIVGVDSRADRRKEAEEKYGVRTLGDFDSALKEGCDAVIISLPPDMHVPFALRAVRAGKHVFMEAGLLEEGMDQLGRLAKRKRVVVAPSCTLRFHPAVKLIKKFVAEKAIGRALTFTYHSGQYLPDWHPFEDYRKFYAARKLTGACREIVPFELVWLTDVFGPVRRVAAVRKRLGDLESDIDDVYQLLLDFGGPRALVGHLLVDVVARVPYRRFRLLGTEGVVEWDWAEKAVRVWGTEARAWESHPADEGRAEAGYVAGESMYVEEMRAFVETLNGRSKWTHMLARDRQVIKVLKGAERSSDSGKWILLG